MSGLAPSVLAAVYPTPVEALLNIAYEQPLRYIEYSLGRKQIRMPVPNGAKTMHLPGGSTNIRLCGCEQGGDLESISIGPYYPPVGYEMGSHLESRR